MKQLILVFCLILGVFNRLLAQEETMPFIIFIDGKYVIGANVFISYSDSNDNKNGKLELNYHYGNIKWEKTELEKLLENKNLYDKRINIEFTEKNKDFSTSEFIYWDFLPDRAFIDKSYLIINILNYNKKKNIYFFDYKSPYAIKKWIWKEEYGNKRLAYRKYTKLKKQLFFPNSYIYNHKNKVVPLY